jgi:hypothetical protein
MYKQAILPGMTSWGNPPAPEDTTRVDVHNRSMTEIGGAFGNMSFPTNMPTGYKIPPHIHAREGILNNRDRIFEHGESISFAIPGGIVYAGPDGFKIVTD